MMNKEKIISLSLVGAISLGSCTPAMAVKTDGRINGRRGCGMLLGVSQKSIEEDKFEALGKAIDKAICEHKEIEEELKNKRKKIDADFSEERYKAKVECERIKEKFEGKNRRLKWYRRLDEDRIKKTIGEGKPVKEVSEEVGKTYLVKCRELIEEWKKEAVSDKREEALIKLCEDLQGVYREAQQELEKGNTWRKIYKTYTIKEENTIKKYKHMLKEEEEKALKKVEEHLEEEHRKTQERLEKLGKEEERAYAKIDEKLIEEHGVDKDFLEAIYQAKSTARETKEIGREIKEMSRGILECEEHKVRDTIFEEANKKLEEAIERLKRIYLEEKDADKREEAIKNIKEEEAEALKEINEPIQKHKEIKGKLKEVEQLVKKFIVYQKAISIEEEREEKSREAFDTCSSGEGFIDNVVELYLKRLGKVPTNVEELYTENLRSTRTNVKEIVESQLGKLEKAHRSGLFGRRAEEKFNEQYLKAKDAYCKLDYYGCPDSEMYKIDSVLIYIFKDIREEFYKACKAFNKQLEEQPEVFDLLKNIFGKKFETVVDMYNKLKKSGVKIGKRYNECSKWEDEEDIDEEWIGDDIFEEKVAEFVKAYTALFVAASEVYNDTQLEIIYQKNVGIYEHVESIYRDFRNIEHDMRNPRNYF